MPVAPQPAVFRPRGASGSASGGELPVINTETLSHLRELSSSAGFVKKLSGVFIADNTALMERIGAAVAARNYGELRSHLHAMKGSSASLGAERLARLCTQLGACTDSELRLQGPQVLRTLAVELASASQALERYVEDKQQAT